jgi:hypothetical protein
MRLEVAGTRFLGVVFSGFSSKWPKVRVFGLKIGGYFSCVV